MVARLFFTVGASIVACSACGSEPAASSTGFDPGAAEPLRWTALEPACFVMGETRVYPEEGPRVDTCVDGFEITGHEITTAQFAAFVAATGHVTRAERGWSHADPDGPGVDLPPGSALFAPPDGPGRALNWWRYEAGASWRFPHGPDGPPAEGAAPVVHVTRADADAYAAWVGARLPTEAEWEYAARGGLEGSLYTWDEAEALALADRANTWQGVFPAVNTADDGHAGLAPVGSYPPNGFGLYDMVGNVWEWTSGPYYPTHAPGVSLRDQPGGHDPSQPGVDVGVIRGGSYLCARGHCFRFRPAARQAQDLAFGTSHIGFRVVRDAED